LPRIFASTSLLNTLRQFVVWHPGLVELKTDLAVFPIPVLYNKRNMLLDID